MSNGEDDHRSPVRNLKQQWKNEDAARDELERQRKKSFLEQQANEVFAPVDNYLARVHKVLHAFGASVEVASVWEHLDDQKLRRTAKVISADPTQRLLLAFV